ncbi:hypothetical protein [Pelosinus sp. IPA-1]|uniref:hypothetical protein n=1 Tax=Pelosinus sp. IPA-1 TaxID=3029569 RepID=UPI00243620B4|nr:hypothetical protein [Pelosinus sp. IPA-1]GMA99903.1 hypothetical protein PIPA1_27030 [Pelosinus sp. IPA-1]
MMQKFIEQQSANWLEEDVPVMQQEFPKNQETITESLSAAIRQICHQASRQQQVGCKGPAAYLCISFLRTNILEDCFQYRMDMYDEKFYLDRTECSGCFEIDFVWQYFQARMAQLEKAVHSSIYKNKIRTRQLNAIKLDMAEQYHQVAMLCTKLLIDEAVKTPEYRALSKVPEFKILMGDYKDKIMLLYEEASECKEM